MEVNEMTSEECYSFLERADVARLGCSLENQPYVVPIRFSYQDGYLYIFATLGQKIEWMRANPKVCVQADEIKSQADWVSVIVNGEYEELREPQHNDERKLATSLLAKRYHWWLNALGERQMRVSESSMEPLFFRIRVESITGLRAVEK